MCIVWGQATHAGLINERNEDALLTLNIQSQTETVQHIGLCIIAHGLGATVTGDHAAHLAVNITASHLMQSVINLQYMGQPHQIYELVIDAIHAANIKIRQQNSLRSELQDRRTTIDVALLLADEIIIGHVGNSRVYIVTQNDMLQITNDHGFPHPQGNILFRALGAADEEVDIYTRSSLAPDSRLLLCTYGLYSVLGPAQIADIVRTTADPQEACDQLISLANDAGGLHNTSVIIVKVNNL